jgi:hypothetical protein
MIPTYTGKRTCDDGPVYNLVESTCFHIWHVSRRAKALEGSRWPAVGIGVVVVRREKTVSPLSDAGSGATESGDVSPALPHSSPGVTLPS